MGRVIFKSREEGILVERIEEEWKKPEHVKAFVTAMRAAVPFGAAQIDVMIRLAGSVERPVENFLDLGCGDGILSEAVLARFPEAAATLIDFSEPMLAEARKRLGGRASKMDIVSGDFADPGWLGPVKGKPPFDLVISGYAIHHQKEERKRELYREIFSILGAGGVFINIDRTSSSSERIKALSDQLFVDSLYAVLKAKGKAKTYEDVKKRYTERATREAHFLSSVDAQCGWLRDTGFVDVDCYFKVFELAVFGGRRP
ncbi:MAG: class I SAM-dependent methyltransferase [Thermodesulfobacteriota bacterium]